MKHFFLLFLALGLGARCASAATPTLSIADASTIEGNRVYRELAFPVTLSAPQTFDVSASFVTRNISADATFDYVKQTAGKLVIKAGQTRANIIIRVACDKIEERDESFLVQLGAPKRCAISDSDAIGTIKDDDYAGQISVSDVSVAESDAGQKNAEVLVTLAPPPLHDVSLRFKTVDDSAKFSRADYLATQGTLLFRTGRRALHVLVPILGDTQFEADERCFLRLESLEPRSDKIATILIRNDDVPASKGKIAFTSRRDGNAEIYVMNADGTGQTRLTQTQATEQGPNFSPDGTKIAYETYAQGNPEIWVMNADGSHPTQITPDDDAHGDYAPCFSPDGRKILFVSFSGLYNDLWIMNADGTGRSQLTFDPGNELAPCFSPDGSQIAFMAYPEGRAEIYRMNADGSNPTRLTVSAQGSNYDPCFSRDGQKIVFSSTRDNDYELFQMNLDGSDVVRLTDSEAGKYGACASPLEDRLAFTSTLNGDYAVWVINADGSAPRRLTHIGENSQPSWAPGSVLAPVRAKPAAPQAASKPSAPSS